MIETGDGMSSKLKDARWAMAYEMAASLDLDFEHFTYEGWNVLLGKAQSFLEKYPATVNFWAEKFGGPRGT